MVILYLYSTCWCMKSVFYECQQRQPWMERSFAEGRNRVKRGEEDRKEEDG
jgi:hypothetical protein